MTLMPVSSSSTDGLSSSNFGAGWWIARSLVRLDRARFVDRTAEHVHDAAECARADWHRDAGAGVLRLHAAAQAVRRAHRDRPHDAVAELLLHLESEALFDQLVGRVRIKNERVVDLRHVVARELDVHDCANALNDGSGGSGAHRISSVLLFKFGRDQDTAAAPPTISDNLLGDAGLPRLVVDELQFLDYLLRIVRRRLHRYHARALLGSHVLSDRLVDQRFGVANQQRIDHRRRIGFVDVVPRVGALFFLALRQVLVRQRNQLLDNRLLLHRVDEAGVGNVHRIDLSVGIHVDQRLNRPDQLFQMRAVADLHVVRHDAGIEPLQESEAPVADRRRVDLDTLRIEFLDPAEHRALDIRVEPAAQTLVGSHEDDPDPLDRVALLQERRLVFRICQSQACDDVADLVAVRTELAHPVLRLAHLGGRDHFHRLGDLARVLNALDLQAYFFGTCHGLLSSGCTRRFAPHVHPSDSS